ncbi:DM13 domain-containing protein [Flavobacteriaceae bacterium F08102]|nr:DM13 domain-containing protein [Flavobacteriaceae bacterium F08102]
MKTSQFLTFLIIAFLVLSCSSDEDDSTSSGQQGGENKELKGSFIAKAHPTSGTVSVNKERTKMTFTNFKTDAGPLLEVWLSTSATPTTSNTYTSIGMLKGIDGNYSYTIPASLDFSKMKIVNIWCVDFSVSFGYAELK